MVSTSFFADGEIYDSGTVTSNDNPASPTASQSPSSLFAGGGVVGEGTVVSNETGPGPQSQAPSSFFADGAVVDTDAVESNDNPGNNAASQAPSSFFQSGNIYDYLSEESAVMVQLEALTDTTTANAASASSSASQASTSEANAAASAAAAAAAVQSAAGTATPLIDGTATVGTSPKWAHEDHVHPKDPTLASFTYVDNKVAGVVNSAPATLDTLNELAAALGNNPNFATTTATQIGLKADKTYVDTQDLAGKAYTDASVFPSGTRMLFQQTAAPTGWTKDATHNDKALRIVSGAVGSGGANAFSTVNAQTTVGATALAASQVPNLSVSVSGTVTVYPAGTSGYYAPVTTGGWAGTIADTSLGGATVFAQPIGGFTYTNSFSGSNSMAGATTSGGGGSHNHTITMNIQYVDVIIAQKN